MNKKIALSNFLMIHAPQINLILIFLYHINRYMHCCIRTRRIETKGKKNDRERGEEGKIRERGIREKVKRSGRKRSIGKEGKRIGEKW